jgi:hypothetical protein
MALSPAGQAHVAYASTGRISVARRTSAGWERFGAALGTPGLTAVTNLSVDHAGNAHVIYYTFVQLTSYSSTYEWRYVRISPSGETGLAVAIGTDQGMLRDEGVALTVDSAGDAHIAFNYYVGSPGSALYYRRTYEGAWLPALSIGTRPLAYPTIAVDDTSNVHIAGHNGTQIYYTRSTGGIFGDLSNSPRLETGHAPRRGELHFDGDTVEYWYETPNGVFRSVVEGETPTSPAAWVEIDSDARHHAGARGPRGYAILRQTGWTSGATTFMRGPLSGPNVTEETNLPVGQILALAYDAWGHAHGIATIEGRSGHLYYLRRE